MVLRWCIFFIIITIREAEERERKRIEEEERKKAEALKAEAKLKLDFQKQMEEAEAKKRAEAEAAKEVATVRASQAATADMFEKGEVGKEKVQITDEMFMTEEQVHHKILKFFERKVRSKLSN